MSANTELGLELVRHFNTLDPEGISKLITDNIKHTAAGTLYNTNLEGRDDYMVYIRNLLSKFQKCDMQPYNVYDVADENVVIMEWTADFITDTGISWESRGVLILDIIDGKVDWVRDYFDTEKTKSIYSSGTI